MKIITKKMSASSVLHSSFIHYTQNVPTLRKSDFCRHKREYPPLSLQKLQMMIDLDRIDSKKLIDIAAIFRTGLFSIDPMRKHFGIQLTDEVFTPIL